MTSQHESPAFYPDDILEVAEAIAVRHAAFSEVTGHIRAGLNDETYTPMTEAERRSKIIGETTLNILRVENPERSISVREVLEATKDRAEFDEMARNFNSRNDPLDPQVSAENIQELLIGFVDEILMSTGMDADTRAAEFKMGYETALQVADEYGVSRAEVYRRDDLYYELQRRVETPEAAATKMVAHISGFSSDAIINTYVRSFEKVVPREILDEMDQADIQELLTEFQLDAELTREMRPFMEIAQETGRQVAMYAFLKTYGYAAFSQLDVDLQTRLLPQRPWIRAAFDDLM